MTDVFSKLWGVQVHTSDWGDEVLQSFQQVSVSLKVIEVMLHPVATHIQHSTGGVAGGGVCYRERSRISLISMFLLFPLKDNDTEQTGKNFCVEFKLDRTSAQEP